MDLQENIKVVARVRPFSTWIGTTSEKCVFLDSQNSAVKIKHPEKEKLYHLNKVFDQNTHQADVYDNVGRHIIDGFTDGITGTIFAYGQTASGKTYTMMGPEAADMISFDQEHRGIIPRAIEHIFDILNAKAEKKTNFSFSMKCSFLELYNEKLYDLLQGKDVTTLKIQQQGMGQVNVIGAAEFDVTTSQDCMKHLSRGWTQREKAETAMNHESSRSHAFFMLTLTTSHNDGAVTIRRTSRLNLVDLAGSERQTQTKNTGERIREACGINLSLSTLARVIRKLPTVKPNTYNGYRDSLLTFLLKDSLGGNSRTTVIVNIHPNAQFVGDTISTLNFAENVKKIKNKTVVDEVMSCEDTATWKAEILRLKEENSRLEQSNFLLLQEFHEYKKSAAELSNLNLHDENFEQKEDVPSDPLSPICETTNMTKEASRCERKTALENLNSKAAFLSKVAENTRSETAMYLARYLISQRCASNDDDQYVGKNFEMAEYKVY